MPEGNEPKNKEEGKTEEKYSIQEIATQSEPRIFDGERTYTTEEALVLVLNQLKEMQDKILGTQK